jgi:demethylmenaquinone methyltransferase/2-methoxy-6-polyprenyl-1,4-benzoquinol methylase
VEIGAEKINPYDNNRSKTEQVQEMFDSIAPAYDFMNRAMTFGIDHLWRAKAVKMMGRNKPANILDVATGTGDLAIRIAHSLHPDHITGIDLSEGMLEIGRKKAKDAGLDNIIEFVQGDCLDLPFDDNTFDCVTVAYGVRNFPDLDKGLSEMRRVLKKDGRLVIIELTAPRRFPMRQLFWLYSHAFMPLVGWIISKDKRAYSYLPATMEAFPQGEEMQQILKKAGYRDVAFKRFTFGLSTMYTAKK